MQPFVDFNMVKGWYVVSPKIGSNSVSASIAAAILRHSLNTQPCAPD
jgi:hypothetical protein